MPFQEKTAGRTVEVVRLSELDTCWLTKMPEGVSKKGYLSGGSETRLRRLKTQGFLEGQGGAI